MESTKGIIKIEDYIMPQLSSQPFYIVHSTWFKEKNEGFIFVEKIDPRSFFYPVKRMNVQVFKDINLIKETHIKLIGKYEWRNKNANQTKS